MNENITYKIEGINEVIEALESLNSKDTFNIIRAVERKALNENIIKPLRAALPYSSRTEKAIRIVQDQNSSDKTAFYAGPTSDAFWLRFVEKGTAERKGRGKITGKPIGINVVESKPEQIVKFFNEDFGKEVNKILERKIKKIQK